MGLLDSIKHGWNAFRDQEEEFNGPQDFSSQGYGISGQSSNYLRGYRYNKSDLVKAVITRIAIDASMVQFQHLKVDEQTGNQTHVKSGLIDVMTYDANLDQTGYAFMYDLFWSMLDEGVIAAVPLETTTEPNASGAYDIKEMRVGKIMQWYPNKVRVRVYNQYTGVDQDIIMPKSMVAILESPLYSLIKESNQTLRLLEAKINRMNAEDSNAASGKLNGFLKTNYATKSESRQKRAQRRRGEIENEMANSKFGLATLDATETYIAAGQGITNNLLDDIRKLQQDFYNQTGMTENIMNGTASESEMLTYYTRTIDPVVTSVLAEFNRKFITKTARSQGQSIQSFRDPFRLVPVEQLADIADTLTRNAILTPNEVRKLVGKPPLPDPNADLAFNRNIGDANQAGGINTVGQGQGVVPTAPGQPQIPNDTAVAPTTPTNDEPVITPTPDFIADLPSLTHSDVIDQQPVKKAKRTHFLQGSKNYRVKQEIKRAKKR